MTIKEGIMFIIFASASVVFLWGWIIAHFKWKGAEERLNLADKEISKLRENLDDALHCPNTVSFNSYECSPITLSTTITVADWSFNHAVNNKDFVEKRDFIIRQAIHEMAEEFTKIPEYIYIDYTQDDIITDNMKVTIKLKILPFKEE